MEGVKPVDFNLKSSGEEEVFLFRLSLLIT
jgi:hypothetical protein